MLIWQAPQLMRPQKLKKKKKQICIYLRKHDAQLLSMHLKTTSQVETHSKEVHSASRIIEGRNGIVAALDESTWETKEEGDVVS